MYYTYVRMYICKYVCTSVRMYVCTHVRKHVHVIYTYTHIHTIYIHIYVSVSKACRCHLRSFCTACRKQTVVFLPLAGRKQKLASLTTQRLLCSKGMALYTAVVRTQIIHLYAFNSVRTL